MQQCTLLVALLVTLMTTVVCRRQKKNSADLNAETLAELSSSETLASDLYEGMTLEEIYAADVELNDNLTAEHPTVPEDIRPLSLMSVSEVISKAGEVNFLIIGDWGASSDKKAFKGEYRKSLHLMTPDAKWGSDQWNRHEWAQENVAKYMQIQAAKLKPVAVLNVGDNFYWSGVKKTSDSRWRSRFEDVYKGEGMNIPWLSVLGNHDYGGDCCDSCLFGGGFLNIHSLKSGCSQAQIDYDTEKGWKWPQKKKTRWVMPDRYYTQFFDFGTFSVEVFLLDTNQADANKICGGHGCNCPGRDDCLAFFGDLWRKQLVWFEKALRESKADKKIVVGHHPPQFAPVNALLPLMKKYGAPLFLSGHVHAMRQDDYDGVHVVMNGAGGGFAWAGGGPSQMVWQGPPHTYGFNTLSVSKEHMTVKYITDQGKIVHTFDAVTASTEAPTNAPTNETTTTFDPDMGMTEDTEDTVDTEDTEDATSTTIPEPTIPTTAMTASVETTTTAPANVVESVATETTLNPWSTTKKNGSLTSQFSCAKFFVLFLLAKVSLM